MKSVATFLCPACLSTQTSAWQRNGARPEWYADGGAPFCRCGQMIRISEAEATSIRQDEEEIATKQRDLDAYKRGIANKHKYRALQKERLRQQMHDEGGFLE